MKNVKLTDTIVLTAKEFVEVYNKSVQAREDESAMDIDEDDKDKE